MYPFSESLHPGSGGSAQLYQALDIAHFLPLADFKARMEQLIAQIKGSALAPGSNGIFFPGEIEYGVKQDRLANGLPMDRFVRAEIRKEAEAQGLAYEIEL